MSSLVALLPAMTVAGAGCESQNQEDYRRHDHQDRGVASKRLIRKWSIGVFPSKGYEPGAHEANDARDARADFTAA